MTMYRQEEDWKKASLFPTHLNVDISQTDRDNRSLIPITNTRLQPKLAEDKQLRVNR